MEQILLAYNLPKETVEAIMVLYKITKVKKCDSDENLDYIDIMRGEVEGQTLV